METLVFLFMSKPWKLSLSLALVGSAVVVAPQGPMQLTAQQDRQRIMDLLQIASIPPGANGAYNPETYNEALANPYPNLNRYSLITKFPVPRLTYIPYA
jgi:hypothetical protein